MSQPEDGGPAFPATCTDRGWVEDRDGVNVQFVTLPGMSLRDWFAGQAMIGLISFENGERIYKFLEGSPPVTESDKRETAKEYFARTCYGLADAMIAHRAKPG